MLSVSFGRAVGASAVRTAASREAMMAGTIWRESVVTRDSPTPLYRQISDVISELILSGQLSADTLLPSEKELGNLYGVSRLTVRQALSDLRRRNLVKTHHGKGTAVMSPGVAPASCLASFTETELRSGRKPQTKIISFGHIVDEEVANCLRLPNRTMFVRVVRLRLVNASPVYLSSIYLPASLAPSLRRSDFPEEGIDQSLWRVLANRCGLILSTGEEVVGARSASKREAALLGVAPLSPLVERTCTMASGGSSAVLLERSLWAQPQMAQVRLMWSGTPRYK